MRRLDVAICGFGTIGRNVGRLLLARQDCYRARFGLDVRLTGICRSRAGLCDDQGLDLTQLESPAAFEPALTGDAFMQRVQADVLFEASPTDFDTGGVGLQYMLAALERGMHIVAVSKGALALEYTRLRDTARRRGVALKFSGATSAALPTIDLLQYNLAGCEIQTVEAILTGTTNVILSAMMDTDCSLETALGEAQRLGIAESNPSFDIDGWDTAAKLTILANAAFDAGVRIDTLPRQGIEHVLRADVATWRRAGLVPKLLGVIEREGERMQAAVRLHLCGPEHPFARIDGRAKAIRVVTDVMGEFMVSGGGSDPLATAAAALKDFEHVLAAAST